MDFKKYITENDVLDLAKNLIKFPSFTEEESECANFLAGYMDDRGFEIELQEVSEGRFQVIGWLRGTGDGKTIMYNGHLDVNDLHLNQKRDPWEPSVENGRLYGHGMFNMKSGVTSMIIAANAVHQSGAELKGDIVITGVVGELQGGVGTVHMLEKGVTADMAVVTEPTDLNLMTIHAGILEMMISTTGISKHISRREGAINALSKMIKVINALENIDFRFEPMPELPGLPRLIVGSILGGLGRDHKLTAYYTPDFCTILTDTRFLPTQTVESVVKDIVTVLQELKAEDPELNYEITLPPLPYRADQVIMPPLDLPKDELIVQTVKRNHELVTGKPVKHIGAMTKFPHAMSYSGDDDAHLYKAGIPAFCYGPSHPTLPGEPPDEYVEIKDMLTCANVLARTAYEICNIPK